MTRFLVATDSVHATAAACDYLDGRLESDDSVRAVAVAGEDTTARDAAEALNVLTVRLPTADATTATREGDPVAEIRAAAADFDADELLLVASEAPDASALGATGGTLLDSVSIPTVVVRAP